LVDGDKPTMDSTCMRPWIGPRKLSIGTMRTSGTRDSPNEPTYGVCFDERWNNTLHRPICAAGLYLNLAYSYGCGFRFDTVVMDGFFQCVQTMVLTPVE
jgi:hypothetical protein